MAAGDMAGWLAGYIQGFLTIQLDVYLNGKRVFNSVREAVCSQDGFLPLPVCRLRGNASVHACTETT